MAGYLDSAFAFGINPLNTGKLSQQQITGLGSIAPQTGLGLQPAYNPMQLDPYSNLPTPTFAKDAAKSFGFAGGSYTQAPAAGDLMTANGFKQSDNPYFDPYYPVESMVALRQSLAPKIAAGADQALQSRGLGYSGLGQGMTNKAMGYLNTIAPQVSPQEAQYMDFQRLYGTNIANSLASGSHHTANWPNMVDIDIPSSMPGATPAAGGTTAEAAFLKNPYHTAEGGLGGLQTPESTVYDFSNGNSYLGPGYFYDPSHMPDVSKMPWLSPPPQPGQQNKYTTNV